MTSHCVGDEYALDKGKQTLFVNTSIAGSDTRPQRQCLVDIELPTTASIGK